MQTSDSLRFRSHLFEEKEQKAATATHRTIPQTKANNNCHVLPRMPHKPHLPSRTFRTEHTHNTAPTGKGNES